MIALAVVAFGMAMIGAASLLDESGNWRLATRRVGGVRFVKVNRLTFSYSVARRFRPIGR